MSDQGQPSTPERRVAGRKRADAVRNLDRLLEVAKEMFATSGVDVPDREIAARAGVGVGTLYRHFPSRSDLIAAVFSREIDACADAALDLSARYTPSEALGRWMQRLVDLLATKRGLAKALLSGDPVFGALPTRRNERVLPALRSLLDAAVAEGEIRDGINADELLDAVSGLCSSIGAARPDTPRRIVALLVDGLRVR